MQASLTLLLVLSFAIGAIPFGWIFAKLWGVDDLRQVGSSNVGATNVVRTAGKVPGALTFLLDFCKSYIPMTFFICFGARCPESNILLGVAAVLGHCYSPFLSLKGGKGVSTALGISFALNPWIGLASLLAYGLGLAMLRVSALGSLFAMLVFLLVELLFDADSLNKFSVLFVVLLVIFRHRTNWDQLLKTSMVSVLLAVCAFASVSDAFAKSFKDFRGHVVEVQSPSRVVALIPSLAEIVIDLDQARRLVGVPEYTRIPKKHKKKIKVLGPYNSLSAEVVYDLKPDLVLVSMDGNFRSLVKKLESLKLTVVVVDTRSVADILRTMKLVAAMLDVPEHSKIAEFSKLLEKKKAGSKKKIFVQVGWEPLYTIGHKTFIHDIVERMGGDNVFSSASEPYPRPNAEEVIERNPEVIVICQLTNSGIKAKKAKKFWMQFRDLQAVKDDKVLIIPGDWIVKPGFSLANGMRELRKVL